MNILMILDDSCAICTIKRAASEIDSISEASSSEEALDVLRSYPSSVVFFQKGMSQINTFAFIEANKMNFPGIDWIIISASKNFYDVREALELGVRDYLLKPLDESEVREVIKRARTNQGQSYRLFEPCYC